MAHPDLKSLRARVSELVQQESLIVQQAVERTRSGDAKTAETLFDQLQVLQVNRKMVEGQIAELLGPRRMYVASELWRTGAYDYRPKVGGTRMRVTVMEGTFGLEAVVPGHEKPVPTGTLTGAFDGPIDD